MAEIPTKEMDKSGLLGIIDEAAFHERRSLQNLGAIIFDNLTYASDFIYRQTEHAGTEGICSDTRKE
jgi:hypothetical protein